jgi:hypothetical protein
VILHEELEGDAGDGAIDEISRITEGRPGLELSGHSKDTQTYVAVYRGLYTMESDALGSTRGTLAAPQEAPRPQHGQVPRSGDNVELF